MPAFAIQTAQNPKIVSFYLDDLIDYSPLSGMLKHGTVKAIYIASLDDSKRVVREQILFCDADNSPLYEMLYEYPIALKLGLLDIMLQNAILSAEVHRDTKVH